MSADFTVLIPVGPAPREVAALADTLDSLAAYEPRARVVLIDDSPKARTQLATAWPDVTVLRTPLWSRRVSPDQFSAMVAGTIEGLRASDGEFVVKMDTDALVIGPFAERVREALTDGVGLVGAYDRSPGGAPRDWSGWVPKVRRARLPIRLSRVAPYLRVLSPGVAAKGSGVVRAASLPGAHCLGGSYAVSRALIDRRDLLDWRPWINTRLSEDVVLGLLCQAAGLEMRGFVDPGEVFGVRWRGLPAPPDILLAQRYAIVHSLKNDEIPESRLRAVFRAARREQQTNVPPTA